MEFDDFVHSFVIKIWLEETAAEADAAVWRGRITHVASAERQFITDINELSTFIWPYLQEMGVKPAPGRRRGRCLRQIMAALYPQVRIGGKQVRKGD